MLTLGAYEYISLSDRLSHKCYSLKNIIRSERERERERWVFSLLVHSVNGCNGQCRKRPQPGASRGSPTREAGMHHLGPSLVAFLISAGSRIRIGTARICTGTHMYQLEPLHHSPGTQDFLKKLLHSNLLERLSTL